MKLNEGDKAKSYLLQFTGIVEDVNGKFICDNLPSVNPVVNISRDDEVAYFHYYDDWGKPATDNKALEKRKDEFLNWMLSNKGLGKEYAEDIAKHYLPSISDALKMPPTKTIWHGLREYLYNAAPAKGVYAVADAKEFEAIFGGLKNIFGKSYEVGKFDQTRYKACWEWSHKSNGSVRAAWLLYQEFLSWKESGTVKDQVSRADDWLTVALKMFAEKRKEEEWCSDNTDGDATKPRAGYVANKQLRVLSNTSADIDKLNGDGASKIKAWFKNYWNVADGKSWLEGLSDADLSGFGPYIAHLLQPGSPAVAKPAKFSNALEAAVKAVIKPEETGLYDERVNETLKFLGLIGFDWNENFDADDLGEAVNAQRVIKRRLKDMGLKRIQESPTADDGNAPDYLTVNEFLWFVNKNLNAIEKQVLEGKMVAAKHEAISSTEKTRKPKCDMSSHDDVLLLRLRAALRTKPFAILAGHSGTGKSRMVRQLAYMTCNDAALRKDEKGNPAKDPGNFCMVQVKPNWHDSGDLLGYYSELGKRYRASDFVKFIVKAYAYPDTPFFVCLDEMNLAPVEQYFAEYLSAIESRKIQKVKVLKGNPLAEADDETVVSDELIPRSAYVEGEEANRVIHYDWLGCELKESEHWIANYGLTIPRNLFVVGTVNMDESTNQFSRKVLDRAMTLEMTDADFKSFGKKGLEPSYDNYMGDDAVADLLAGKIQAEKLEDHQIRNLNALKTVLGATSFAVAYRFANEYALYETSLKETQTKTDTTSVPTPAAGAPAPAPAVNAAQAAAPATPPPDGETAAATPAEAVPAIPAKPLAFDDMILMKVLPRISGEDVVVRRIFFGENGKFSDPKPGSLLELVQKGGTDTESVRKIKAIDERGGAYLSFWP